VAAPLKPFWANLRTVRELYCLGEHRLVDLVASGAVRSAKFGPTRQSSRLYCVADIENALADISSGRPLCARRSVFRATRPVKRKGAKA
jgi:hypothetical protein